MCANAYLVFAMLLHCSGNALSGNNRNHVYTHVVFGEKLLAKGSSVVIHGDPFLIDFGQNQRAGAKPVMYTRQRLGGLQITISLRAYKTWPTTIGGRIGQ